MKKLLWTLPLCVLLILTGCAFSEPAPHPPSAPEGGLSLDSMDKGTVCPYGWLQYDAGTEIAPEGIYLAEDPAFVSAVWDTLQMQDWQTGSEDTRAMTVIRLQFDGVDIVEITPNDIAARDGLYYTVPAGVYQKIVGLLEADARNRLPMGAAAEE